MKKRKKNISKYSLNKIRIEMSNGKNTHPYRKISWKKNSLKSKQKNSSKDQKLNIKQAIKKQKNSDKKNLKTK